MKKNAPRKSASDTPSEGSARQGREGGGVGKIPQSTIKLLRPDQVWHPKIGAPYGNRNALKPINAIHRRVRGLKRRIRVVLKAIP